MSQTIELSDDVFEKLKNLAVSTGMTPEAWIERTLGEKSNGKVGKEATNGERKDWSKFIGAIDSSQIAGNPDDEIRSLPKSVDKVFGDVVMDKMNRIGLKIPE